MRIHAVSSSLRSPGHRYTPHNTSNGLEGYFDEYAHRHAAELDTDWIYLPVRWTNNYVRSRQERGEPDLIACPRHQAVLNSLPANERYFTVVQSDDGIYEDVPPNVLVFGAGGVGDVPVPLLCSPHTRARGGHRPRLASFIGQVNCGGPKRPVDGTKARRSSFDPDANGMKIRWEMVRQFTEVDDCLIDLEIRDTEYFQQEMIRSVFALSPRGYGRTSFRMYEAMDLGCIPLYLYDEPWLPYADKLNWHTFSVLCPMADIIGLPERLRAISYEWRSRALSEMEILYDDYFTLNGMCRQIFRMIKERT